MKILTNKDLDFLNALAFRKNNTVNWWCSSVKNKSRIPSLKDEYICHICDSKFRWDLAQHHGLYHIDQSNLKAFI